VRLPHLAMLSAEWAVLRWLLPLALLHGMLYLALVPPWQHYDEPGHFEYVAMEVAGMQAAAATQISAEIADSMVRHDFLQGRFQPDILNPNPVSLGERQFVHPPTYYALVALPIGWLRYLTIEQQLYAARAVNVVLYALTVIIAWRIAVVVAPEESVVQLALPLLVMLTPPFADIMTAVNNDVLLNMAAAATTLGCVLLIRDGLRPAAALLAVLGLLVAVISKRTGLVLAPLVGFAIVWAVNRRPLPTGLTVGLLGGAVLILGAVALQLVQVEHPGGFHSVLAARPWLVSFDRTYLRLDVNTWIQSVTDLSLIGGRYRVLVVVAFSSFWARLGWGEIVVTPWWDLAIPIAVVTLISIVGLLRGALTRWGALPLWQQRSILLFLLAVALAWLALAARLHPLPPLELFAYTPRGRYLFWALIPTLWLLLLGFQWALPAAWQARGPWLIVGCFVGFDLLAMASLVVAHQ